MRGSWCISLCADLISIFLLKSDTIMFWGHMLDVVSPLGTEFLVDGVRAHTWLLGLFCNMNLRVSMFIGFKDTKSLAFCFHFTTSGEIGRCQLVKERI